MGPQTVRRVPGLRYQGRPALRAQACPPGADAVLRTFSTFLRMIKLPYSIFALPFALSAAVLASREVATTWTQWAWIVACMVTARSSAMGFNRLVDRDIDAANPRTADRELPSGQLGVGPAWAYTLGTGAAFVACAGMLGTTTLVLAPVALLVLWGYSLVKRVWSGVHLVLGVAQGLAPIAVWIALTGTVAAPAWVLALIVGTWVSGFDIIYSCQDAGFDDEAGLHSLPAALGLAGALRVSAVLHGVTAVGLLLLPAVVPLAPWYFLGAIGMIGVLAWEHRIVRPDDLSRVNKAFFDLNGYVSMLFLGTVLVS